MLNIFNLVLYYVGRVRFDNWRHTYYILTFLTLSHSCTLLFVIDSHIKCTFILAEYSLTSVKMKDLLKMV
jgi:hypothetical protein